MTETKDSQTRPVALSSPDWEDYALLDSGDGHKLERFGPYTFVRPEPQAAWRAKLPPERWNAADAVFEITDKKGGGEWRFSRPLRSPWVMQYKALKFLAQVTASRHLGVFPENATHWDWIKEQIEAARRPVQVLNLFGYTGLATLAAAQAGAKVTHVDAARQAVRLARQNQALSGLEACPIRWIIDDALKFAQREERRGARYEGVIMDPPRFGRGAQGEVWEFLTLFSALCEVCRAILSPRPLFLVLTAYTPQVELQDLRDAISGMMGESAGTLTAGRLVTVEQSAGRVIPNALCVRWAAASS
jgi:23S rRNA (cytosine1962-C5)-methyltransferase